MPADLLTLTTTVTALVTNDSEWGFKLDSVHGSMFWLPLPPTLSEGDVVKITITKVEPNAISG